MKATRTNITVAAKIVRQGGLVVYPTETVYGLGCDPLNVEAVQRLLWRLQVAETGERWPAVWPGVAEQPPGQGRHSAGQGGVRVYGER